MVKRSFSRMRQTPLAFLDIGTHKICCWVARQDEEEQFYVTGFGHQATRGYYGGHVRDLEALEETITGAVHEAEKTSGETIRRIFVSVNGACLSSFLKTSQVSLLGKSVSDEDLRRLFLDARLQDTSDPFQTLHALPLNYILDQERDIENPAGMLGESLSGVFHVVGCSFLAMRNFFLAIEQSHLEPIAFVAAPYAAGLSVLTEDERALGTTLIDVGASTIGLGVFSRGQLIHTDSVPLGGQHITMDLAHGLETSISHAERLKVLYGTCFATPKDSHEMIRIPLMGDSNTISHGVPRSAIIDILQPRVEEMLLHVRQKLQKIEKTSLGTQRLVLTGGGSQLPGFREFAQERLGRSIRLGKPTAISGVPGGDRPEFATTVGLLSYVETEEFKRMSGFLSQNRRGVSFFRQMTSWFKENL